jgi:HSP20 family protein
MATLQQLKSGINRAWNNLAEGWHHLQQSASHALTRFNPVHSQDNSHSTEQALMHASHWGVLTAEISEENEQIIVRLEIPGMESADFDIQIVDDMLVVRGEKHIEKSEQQGRYHIMECAYGSFERAIPLPTAVDEEKASAKYRRGVLQITLPKQQIDKQKRIEVKEGK